MDKKNGQFQRIFGQEMFLFQMKFDQKNCGPTRKCWSKKILGPNKFLIKQFFYSRSKLFTIFPFIPNDYENKCKKAFSLNKVWDLLRSAKA